MKKEKTVIKNNSDGMKSPESLNDCIKVSNPAVWTLLICVIAVLTGTCIWGFFGHIDSTAATTVSVENGAAVCYVDEEEISSVEEGMKVKFADSEATVAAIGEKGNLGYACILETDSPAADGLYDGKIVIKSIRPVSFILN